MSHLGRQGHNFRAHGLVVFATPNDSALKQLRDSLLVDQRSWQACFQLRVAFGVAAIVPERFRSVGM